MFSLFCRYSLDQTFGVLQCGSSKVLSDTNQTDSIYLHNLIIYPNSVMTKHQCNVLFGSRINRICYSHCSLSQRWIYSGFHKSKSKDKFLPSIQVSCTSFSDGLHKNSQLLQSLICPNSHTNYTDSQAIISYTTKQASQIKYFYS